MNNRFAIIKKPNVFFKFGETFQANYLNDLNGKNTKKLENSQGTNQNKKLDSEEDMLQARLKQGDAENNVSPRVENFDTNPTNPIDSIHEAHKGIEQIKIAEARDRAKDHPTPEELLEASGVAFG